VKTFYEIKYDAFIRDGEQGKRTSSLSFISEGRNVIYGNQE
jgi:hypothetical protein